MIRRTVSTSNHAWEEARTARQAFRKYDPAMSQGEGRYYQRVLSIYEDDAPRHACDATRAQNHFRRLRFYAKMMQILSLAARWRADAVKTDSCIVRRNAL
jgi:hypothetical protein